MCAGALFHKICLFQDRLRRQEIQQRGVVCLDDEEKDLLEGYAEQGWTDNDIGRVRPDIGSDEIAIPRDGSDDGDGD